MHSRFVGRVLARMVIPNADYGAVSTEGAPPVKWASYDPRSPPITAPSAPAMIVLRRR